MYPTIYSKSSLRVCGKTEPQCDLFEISLQSNLWEHCDYIAEYFMKEVSMSGSDPEWIYCEQNCERNQEFLSQRTHWFLFCFLFECNHHVIAGYIAIKVVFSFQMQSQFDPWVHGDQGGVFFSKKLSMYPGVFC